MKLYPTKLMNIIFLIIFNTIIFCTYAAGSGEFYLDREKNYHHNLEILNFTTNLFKEDGRPKASTGTVMYTYAPNGEIYINWARKHY